MSGNGSSAVKNRRRQEPKPCPRCYAPMRLAATGYECERHGAPPPDRPVMRRREAVVQRTPRPRAQRASRPSKPRVPSGQTQSLLARQAEIIARNREGESLASIAADLWQELGYADEYVCASKISRFL